jgi:hypothetical protein
MTAYTPIGPAVADIVLHLPDAHTKRGSVVAAVARRVDALVLTLLAQIDRLISEIAERDRRIAELEQRLAMLTEEESHG